MEVQKGEMQEVSVDTSQISRVVTKSSVKGANMNGFRRASVEVKDMTLERAIEMVAQRQNLALATAFIQHHAYQNQANKDTVYQLSGIRHLVRLLDESASWSSAESGGPEAVREVLSGACGALRNLVYVDSRNKEETRNAGGLPVLAHVLASSGDAETLRQASGALWNLSSMESLKEEIVATSLDVLVRRAQGTAGNPNPDTEVFYNVTGCLRNLSSASQSARGSMRESPGLIDSLVKFTSNAVEHGTLNETAPESRVRASVENCVCTLRNLTYRLSDEAGPSVAAQLQAQPNNNNNIPPFSAPASPGTAPSDYEEPGCFSSRSRAIKEAVEQQDVEFTKSPRGAQWLWNPQTVRLYAELLKTRASPPQRAGRTPDNLREGAAGALQNVTAGNSGAARTLGKILLHQFGAGPVLAQSLNPDLDTQSLSAASCLVRNLSRSPSNRAELAKHVLSPLCALLPPIVSGGGDGGGGGDEVTSTCLYSLSALMLDEAAARNVCRTGSLKKIYGMATDTSGMFPKSVPAAALALQQLWSFKDLRREFKKSGWTSDHFLGPALLALRGQNIQERHEDGTLRT